VDFDFPLGSKVVFDTDVLFGFPTVDTILILAEMGILVPFWSEFSMQELRKNLLSKLRHSPESIDKRIGAMNKFFPDAMVVVPETLRISMPNHPKDRHVLAAAVVSGTRYLVTFNIKDFVGSESVGVQTLHPDIFLSNLYEIYPEEVLFTLDEQVIRLKNSQKELKDIIQGYRKAQMKKFPGLLEKVLEERDLS
jgi:predicted nucleic acid-binding protein